jgi:prevent-host-death family protein
MTSPASDDAPINIYDAKTQLSALVERAAAGEEIVIAKAGKPVARLVPLARRPAPLRFGAWEGQGWVAADFDAPDPDLVAAFEGEAAPLREAAEPPGRPPAPPRR